jgi:hypothetical protein
VAEKTTTPIRVYEKDKKRLEKEGKFTESYAEVVERLLNSSDEQEQEATTTEN